MDVALASLNAAQAGSAARRDLERRIEKLEAEVRAIRQLLESVGVTPKLTPGNLHRY